MQSLHHCDLHKEHPTSASKAWPNLLYLQSWRDVTDAYSKKLWFIIPLDLNLFLHFDTHDDEKYDHSNRKQYLLKGTEKGEMAEKAFGYYFIIDLRVTMFTILKAEMQIKFYSNKKKKKNENFNNILINTDR